MASMQEKTKKTPAKRTLKQRWQALRTKYKDTPHQSFKLTHKEKRFRGLQGVREGWQLVIDSFRFMRRYPKIFIPFVILYGLVGYFLIGGISQFDYVTFRENATQAVQGSVDAVSTSMSLFGATVLGSLNQEPNEVQRVLSGLLALLFWLAIIWVVRMISADKSVKLREAFYNSPTPLISTLFVLMVMVLQLIPAALGLFAFSVALNDQWINSAAEGLAFSGAAILLCLLSLYWLTGSLIATMVVALPGVYPMQALASARRLVLGKRWSIALRIVAMIIIQVLIWMVILFPVIMLEGWLRIEWLPLVPVTVQLLSGFTLVFSSVYVYKLYRSLL